jgi:multiphosphoryl transfer protein
MSEPMRLVLKAPLSGIVVPLDEVPDPVFAGRMVGDGVSVDPVTASLTAPCDGRVVQLHSASHAVTLASSLGVEILMHVGLDTVHLKGRGFTPRVRVGDAVRTGDILIDFDADYVATHARSLLTEIVITSTERVAAMHPASGSVAAGADTILSVTLKNGPLVAGGPAAGPAARDAVRSEPLVISNASGLHARPAALLANRAKRFTADVRVRRLHREPGGSGVPKEPGRVNCAAGDSEVNARSVVGIMGLEIARGDRIEIVASGPDANEAVQSLSQLIRDGLGEGGAAPAAAEAAASVDVVRRPRSDDPNVLTGVAASPGLAVGNIVQVRHEQLRVVEDATDARHERQALDAALEHAKAELDALQARLQQEGAGGKAAIFAAHRELLDDPDLLDIAGDAVSSGKSAAFGWRQAYTRHADRLANLKNELLAARANDLRDVGRRVLQKLAGVDDEPVTYEADSILVAEELTPSDTASLDRARVLGLCTTTGGASSHVAILARSLDIPLVAGIDPQALDLANGTEVILDGTRGTLRVNPTTAEIARIRQRQEDQSRERRAQHAHAHEPATTVDGHRIEVEANIGGLADAEQALALGADGVGLFRSEFLFLHRATAPTDDEQRAAYGDVARALGARRRLVVRTLDVGGDKPLPYLPLPREDNPFLGERGVRVMLNRPELLRAQLRAILLAAREGHVAVMFPMIASLDEWRTVRDVLESERRKLDVPRIEAGIMIEVPSAALVADHFAAEVDFFSIGTNDLTQYTLAMDRGHPRLAPHVDGLSPAVLRLVDQTARAAQRHGRRTAVCGGIAGDPQAVPLLLGLGIDELSVTVPAIPVVKAQIRRLRMEECRALAQTALACATAAEVRALVPLEGRA